jgi:hypothetical protein
MKFLDRIGGQKVRGDTNTVEWKEETAAIESRHPLVSKRTLDESMALRVQWKGRQNNQQASGTL